MSSVLELSALYERFLTLNGSELDASPFPRRPSACSPDPSRCKGGSDPPADSLGWGPRSPWSPGPEPPRGAPSAVGRPPVRSISLIEGGGRGPGSPPVVPPPPGFPPLRAPAAPAAPSSRYKTELCRTFEESGRCKYGVKCQFAHGAAELRQLSRHPKYKTELCHKFYLHGQCPYGARCHFIHHPGEERAPHALRQSLSYSGAPSGPGPRASPPPPDPSAFARAPSASPPPSDLLSPSAFSGLLGGGGGCGGPGRLGPEPVPRGATVGEPAGAGCCACRRGPGRGPGGLAGAGAALFPGGLPRTPSAHSLSSDLDCYSSSGSLSGSDSPVFELPGGAGGAGGVLPAPALAPSRRLPIFNRLSVSE
ncbi:mRNA decay activator protein ZFP36 [Ornithorhynchus anatinus]|uniref:mRNA decay activator protein ZFP36 n=1 Tax=Ornithorhynchus anatinus TaxID=9258 RepID=UPI0010A91EB9|nr:mRNA decay activator protein ZFP36 [Ornithorhynchus anatinus]